MSKKILLLLQIVLISSIIFFPNIEQIKAQGKCQVVADIVFAIDTTGSMGGVIAQAKAQALNIMNGIENSLSAYNPDVRYGVVDFRDYADGGNWPCYQRQALTYDKNAVKNAINAMSAGGGGDLPEAYARVMYESYNSFNYRNEAVKILVMIGDDVPHDKASAVGENSDDGAYSSPNYYDPVANKSTDDIAKDMNAHGIILINLHAPNHSADIENIINTMWASIAQITGGNNYSISTNPNNLADVIVNAVIKAIFDHDGDGYMTLECPCDPENLPPGITGCYDCNDTDRNEIYCCFCGGIVPCGRKVDCPSNCPNGTLIDERTPCNLCHLLVLLKKLVDFTITFILFPLAALMIAIGSLFIMTAGGDPGKVAQGKKMIMTVLIGVAIVLGGWLVVDTIITFLTPASSPLQHWSQITC